MGLKFGKLNKLCSGLGHLYVDKNGRVGDIIPTVNAMAGFEKDTQLMLFEVTCQAKFLLYFTVRIIVLTTYISGNQTDHDRPYGCTINFCSSRDTRW